MPFEKRETSRRGWYWMQAALPLHHAATVEPFAGRR